MDTQAADIDRAPSRTGHRRPALKRTNASFNLFPDLPPIRDIPLPALKVSGSDSDGSSSGSDSEDELNLKVELAPLCPPSPPSPGSPSSDSSSISTLFSPIDQTEWEQFHDGFAPPPISEEPIPSAWPATPYPSFGNRFYGDLTLEHHGWSCHALYDLKTGLWVRRQVLWYQYEAHCRHIASFRTDDSEDGLALTLFFPPPPVLPRSRPVTWMSANGRSLPSTERVREPLPQRDPAWKREREYYQPIYPRAGDISDLRDNRCEEVDRKFFSLPTHRVKQLVYLNEMKTILSAPEPRFPPRRTTALPPASPLAQSWTPDSPLSVYSQDSAATVSPLMASFPPPSPPTDGALSFSSSPSLLDTRWKSRWDFIDRSFTPPTPPPATRFALYVQASPPTTPPPRPGTPLPDECTLSITACEVPLEVAPPIAAANPHVAATSTAPVLPVGDTSPDVAVHLPASTLSQLTAPVPLRPPTPASLLARPSGSFSADASSDIPQRPPSPFVHVPSAVAAAASIDSASEPQPVVNLPRAVRTLPSGPSISRNVQRNDESNSENAVRFSVRRPIARAGSPKFMFFVSDDGSDSEDSDTDSD